MSKNDELSLYWGEMHDNTHQAEDPDFSMDERLRTASQHLDFYCAAYYPSTSPAFKKGGHPSDDAEQQPLNVEVWKSDEQIDAEWSDVKRAVQRYNSESFVVYPGFEWQGDGTWGDHNVFYNEDNPPLYKVDSLVDLYTALRKHTALAIPHHTAYIGGFRGKNWDFLDENLSPFAEIYSIHGSSEGDQFGAGLRSNPFLGPDVSEGSYSAALSAGKILGAVGSTDNWGPLPGHYGRGLAAVWSEGLNRRQIWEAFKDRRVYAVSGDRIALRFNSGENPMGAVLPAFDGLKEFLVEAEGLDEIDYIDFLRDEKIIERFSPLGGPGGNAEEYLFRIEFGWGPSSNVMTLGPKEWKGSLVLTEGTILSVVPCWISEGHSYDYSGSHLQWSGSSRQDTVASFNQNAYVVKVSGSPETKVCIEIDGITAEMSLGEMSRGSRILWNRKESADFIKAQFKLDPESLDRKDVIFGMAYKCRISRALPVGAYKVSCRFSDDSAGGHVYRVRVVQKNGHKAWSSPIWFK